MAELKSLHDSARFNIHDEYFICGGNPDGSGGGIIGTATSYFQAVDLKSDAVNQGYRNVVILTSYELFYQRKVG